MCLMLLLYFMFGIYQQRFAARSHPIFLNNINRIIVMAILKIHIFIVVSLVLNL